MNKDLKKRTAGEELWLYRKYKGLRQEELAVKLGIGRTTYWKIETDQIEFEVPSHYSVVPSLSQQLALARRRAGWSLRRTAAKMGISHVSFLKREQNGSLNLMVWWRTRGFFF